MNARDKRSSFEKQCLRLYKSGDETSCLKIPPTSAPINRAGRPLSLPLCCSQRLRWLFFTLNGEHF